MNRDQGKPEIKKVLTHRFKCAEHQAVCEDFCVLKEAQISADCESCHAVEKSTINSYGVLRRQNLSA